LPQAGVWRDVAVGFVEEGVSGMEGAEGPGLGGVEAAGSAGRCLGITRRCLEEAGRHGHLQEVLTWEAVRWMGWTLDALSQDVK
jgi:hypothetical protein